MEIETIKLPPSDPDIRIYPLTQPDRAIIDMLAADYYSALVPAQDETHPKHEEAVGMVEIRELVLNLLGLLPQMELQNKYNSNMQVRDLAKEDVAALLMLREELALHVNRHGDEHKVVQLTELTLFLAKIGQA